MDTPNLKGSRMDQNITDRNVTEPFTVPTSLSGINIGTWQEDFPLTGRDYEHLKNGRSKINSTADSILLTSLGIGLNLAGKAITQISNSEIVIYKAEFGAFICGILISVILYIIGFCLPNDRTRLMKKLKNHFDNSPKKRTAIFKPEDEQ